jgi:hypothetical protein
MTIEIIELYDEELTVEFNYDREANDYELIEVKNGKVIDADWPLESAIIDKLEDRRLKAWAEWEVEYYCN